MLIHNNMKHVRAWHVELFLSEQGVKKPSFLPIWFPPLNTFLSISSNDLVAQVISTCSVFIHRTAWLNWWTQEIGNSDGRICCNSEKWHGMCCTYCTLSYVRVVCAVHVSRVCCTVSKYLVSILLIYYALRFFFANSSAQYGIQIWNIFSPKLASLIASMESKKSILLLTYGRRKMATAWQNVLFALP